MLAVPMITEAQPGQPPECDLDFRINVFSPTLQYAASDVQRAGEDEDFPDFYYYSDGEYQLAAFQTNKFSKPYAYRGETPLTFYNKTVDGEGNSVYQAAFAVNLNPAWTSALILVIPSKSDPSDFSAFAFDTSSQNLQAGNIRIYNLSTRAVVLNANGENHQLSPLKFANVNITGIERNILPVALALKEDEDYELVYRRKWSMRNNTRGLYFLYTMNEDAKHWYVHKLIL